MRGRTCSGGGTLNYKGLDPPACRIDLAWQTHLQFVLFSGPTRSIKGCCMCCSVCGKVHLKDPLLLIGKSSLYGESMFPPKKYVTMAICLMSNSQWYENQYALETSLSKTNFPVPHKCTLTSVMCLSWILDHGAVGTRSHKTHVYYPLIHPYLHPFYAHLYTYLFSHLYTQHYIYSYGTYIKTLITPIADTPELPPLPKLHQK